MEKTVKEKFLISKIYGAYYEIYSPSLGKKRAVLRGKFRIENSIERHPFVVGDSVLAEISSGDEWVITDLHERKNFLVRKSGLGDTHVLCANIDQIAVLASLKDPETKEGFIDRALIAAGAADLPALIVFTKSDLIQESEPIPILDQYADYGYKTILVSALKPEEIKQFKKELNGKITFFVGNSGVGKSTILNKFLDEKFQTTAEVSQSTKKGRHTTTNSNLIPLQGNISLIDSPGLKEWGLLHLSENEIISNFPGLSKFTESCDEKNCCNLGDNCKIQEILEKGNFPENRKKSLESIIESLNEENSAKQKQDRYHKYRKKVKAKK